jgi:hypothetical protein
MAIVLLISGGVSLASYGELRFNMVGFITQALAVAVSTSFQIRLDTSSSS